jgi:hypothetical protein
MQTSQYGINEINVQIIEATDIKQQPSDDDDDVYLDKITQ